MRISRVVLGAAVVGSVLLGLVTPADAAPAPAPGAAGSAAPISITEAMQQHANAVRAGTVTPADSWCQSVFMYSQANDLYVSAEIGRSGDGYGVLRARATSVGPWETFTLCFVSDYYYTLVSQANGLYVSAELGWSGSNYGILRARATSVGPWEQLNWDCGKGCWWTSIANGNYVSVELGWTGDNNATLRARATELGPWEEFN
jgi:hypothetical protein